MAFEGMKPYTIDLCTTCAEFLAGSRPWTGTAKYGEMMARNLGVPLTQVTDGCGRECEEHGIEAIGFPDLETWREENSGTQADCEDALEAAWQAHLETREIEPWTSSATCDGCGDWHQGHREHATMWVQEV